MFHALITLAVVFLAAAQSSGGALVAALVCTLAPPALALWLAWTLFEDYRWDLRRERRGHYGR